MDLVKAFSTDKSLELNGVWVPLGDSAELLIARLNNPEYRKSFESHITRYKSAVEKGTLDEETAKTILIEVMAKTILLDWKGLTWNEEEFPYSYENAVKVLTELDDFRDFVTSNAERMNNFKSVQRAAAVKNSAAPSNGKSSGAPTKPSSEA